jgi:hypothetical protein
MATKVKVEILKVATGEVRIHEEVWDPNDITRDSEGEHYVWQNITYWWSEGNGSCDCNRYLFFQRAKDEPEQPENGICLGEGQYQVKVYDDTGMERYIEGTIKIRPSATVASTVPMGMLGACPRSVDAGTGSTFPMGSPCISTLRIRAMRVATMSCSIPRESFNRALFKRFYGTLQPFCPGAIDG